MLTGNLLVRWVCDFSELLLGFRVFCALMGESVRRGLWELGNCETHVFICMYVLQYHPDVNKQAGAEEKFKEISNAYEVRLQLPFLCLLLLLFALI